MTANDYLTKMRDGEELKPSQQIMMIIRLSIPAMLAQLSSIIMQYIDASMVGRLERADSAAIGLVSSTTWLFGGLMMAAGIGFTVQIAKAVGAKQDARARNLVKTGLICVAVFSVVLLAAGAALSSVLPVWLGADDAVKGKASAYFLVFALSIPFVQLNHTSVGMIQASGNMRVPSLLEVVMCALDVVFNALLIFPSGTRSIFGLEFYMPGAGLGITGAALGTALAEAVVSLFLLWFLLFRSGVTGLKRGEKLVFSMSDIKRAVRLAIPVAAEQIVTGSAYIAFTRIVSPLGEAAIAANSFSITAESLVYMPGYGIGAAASTIIGQSIGARRVDLTNRLGRLAVFLGVAVMTAGGAFMYAAAPYMISILSPDPEIQALGARILRIEAFAEPLFAASIVATGVFRGAGDTVVPTAVSLVSMWCVRIPLAAFLSGTYGLPGVWIAMAFELCVRGALFIILLFTRFKKRAVASRYIRE
ncbi:MAG: MATE family efflux transporter [Clostridia bacterium]|nr:MATE family efflux transporter [Clostridia bacterium]